MQTYLVYGSAILIAWLMAYRAQRRNIKTPLILAALMLTFIAGLRAASVGIDTQGYITLFARIAEGKFELAYGLETSFKYICAFLLGIWNHPNFLFFVFSLITNLLIFARLWDFKEQISLPWAVIVYFGVFYFMTFNIMRQFMAAAIIFFATRYIAQKKYLKFLVFVAIAFLFHKSAIIGVLFILLDIFAWKYLTKKQKNLMRILLIAAPIIAVLAIVVVLKKYAGYFQNVQFDFGIMLFIKLIIFVFTCIFMMGDHKGELDRDGYPMAAYMSRTTKVYYVVGLLMTMLGYMFLYVDRGALYFYLFEVVYIGTVMKSKRIDILVKSLVAGLWLIILFGTLFGNGQGQGNYLFAWQQ